MDRSSRAKVFGVAGFERQFAIKRFLPELAAAPSSAQALSAAARSYGSLEHPRIARMSEFGVAQGQTFTAVELVAGLDVMRLVAESRLGGSGLAAGGALALISQAARAVGYAHGRGLSHLGIVADERDRDRRRRRQGHRLRHPRGDDHREARRDAATRATDRLSRARTARRRSDVGGDRRVRARRDRVRARHRTTRILRRFAADDRERDPRRAARRSAAAATDRARAVALSRALAVRAVSRCARVCRCARCRAARRAGAGNAQGCRRAGQSRRSIVTRR